MKPEPSKERRRRREFEQKKSKDSAPEGKPIPGLLGQKEALVYLVS